VSLHNFIHHNYVSITAISSYCSIPIFCVVATDSNAHSYFMSLSHTHVWFWKFKTAITRSILLTVFVLVAVCQNNSYGQRLPCVPLLHAVGTNCESLKAAMVNAPAWGETVKWPTHHCKMQSEEHTSSTQSKNINPKLPATNFLGNELPKNQIRASHLAVALYNFSCPALVMLKNEVI
jgi:hypothetical protein